MKRTNWSLPRNYIIVWSALASWACSDLPLDLPAAGAIDLAAPWAVVAPDQVNMDRNGLRAAGELAGQITRMRSLLVVRQGRLAYERYYGGRTAETLSDARSVTKSVVSTLVGIAINEGHIGSLDQPITDFLSSPEITPSSAHSRVTIRHLLTMTGGFYWDESNAQGYNDWITSEDHIGYILERPFSDQPGSAFRYNSAAVHLLGVVVASATGKSLSAYADEVLFGPMGISELKWEELSSGRVNGGAGLDLRPYRRPGSLRRPPPRFLNSAEWDPSRPPAMDSCGGSIPRGKPFSLGASPGNSYTWSRA